MICYSTRRHSLYHSLSLDVSLVCLFINDLKLGNILSQFKSIFRNEWQKANSYFVFILNTAEILNFEEGPGVPLLNFRGVSGPLLNFKGGPGYQDPEVPGPGVLVPLLHHARFYFANSCTELSFPCVYC